MKLSHILSGLAALVFVVTQSAVAHSEGDTKYVKLDGLIHVSKSGCRKNAKRPCLAFFELRGKPARQLFDNMRAKAKPDICTGGKMKTDQSGLHCFRGGDGDYGCWFGYHFTKYRIVEGSFSC